MSADFVRIAGAVPVEERASRRSGSLFRVECWNPKKFAREQIRRLVRQVFCGTQPAARQVVFSAVETESEIGNLCSLVGETLATEMPGHVAVSGVFPPAVLEGAADHDEMDRPEKDRSSPLRQIAVRVRSNLWLVPARSWDANCSAACLHGYLSQIRKEFDYSVIQANCAAESTEATAMAQFADGIVLVLSAQTTRRATARKIKDALEEAGVHLLGTVLSEREFPIPQGIYRRL